MRVAVGITAWRRPEYFARVVKALAGNPDARDLECLVSVDGGYPDAQEAIGELFRGSGLRGEILMQERNLGCAGNTGLVFRTLFESGADAGIMLEDDTLPSVDFLHYMRAMLKRFRADERVFTVSASHRRVRTRQVAARKAVDVKPGSSGWTRVEIDLIQHMFPTGPASVGEGRADAVFFRDGFNCHGWGTWRRVQEEIGDRWFGVTGSDLADAPDGEAFLHHVTLTPHGSWGWAMMKYWRRGRVEVAPDLGRVSNIGEHGGAFNPQSEWHRRSVRTEIWMDRAEGYFGDFRLITAPS